MNYILSEEDIKFNESLDAINILQQMGFTDKAYYVEDKTIRLYCPIHKDQIRRSLLIDREKNTYKCSYASCLAYKGGLLLEFYSNYMGIDISEVRKHINQAVFPEKDLSLLADDFIHSGALKEALPILQKAVETRPHNGMIRCKLGALLLEMGKKEEGMEQYFKAAEDFGICGELDKTLNIYNILIILGPENIKVRKQLSYLFSRLGRNDAAAEQLKWVVDSLLKRGLVEEAQEVCDEIIELAPKEPVAYRMKGNIFLRIGLLSDGVRMFEKSATLYLDKGDKQSAIATAEMGLKIYPDKPALMEIMKRANETQETVSSAKSEEEKKQEQEFMEWIQEVSESLSVPATQLTATGKQDTTEILPTDKRVKYFKGEISKFNYEQIESMRKHLVGMFQDVKKTFEDGCIEPWEMKIIKEFYKSFCVALEQYKQEKGI